MQSAEEILTRGTVPEVRARRLAAIPSVVLAKLAHVRELAETAMAASVRVNERLRDAIAEIREAESQKARSEAHIQASPAHRRWMKEHPEEGPCCPGHFTDPAVVEAVLSTATATRDRLREQHAELSARAAVQGRLAQCCGDYASGATPETLTAAVARCARAARGVTLPRDAGALSAAFENVREKLGALAAEQAILASAPVPFSEARERVLAALEGARGWIFELSRYFAPDYFPARDSGLGLIPDPQDTPGVMLSLLGEAFRARALAALEAEAERHPEAVASGERTARLTALETSARELAVGEELLCLALERAGMNVVRREDADPEAVLCTTLP